MFTKDGISTTFLPMKAPRRTKLPGTARKPASRNCSSLQLLNLLGTLSHHGPWPAWGAVKPLPAVRMTSLSLRRKDSRTAFFSH